eukprot:4243769-Amphidinium_carterae.1
MQALIAANSLGLIGWLSVKVLNSSDQGPVLSLYNESNTSQELASLDDQYCCNAPTPSGVGACKVVHHTIKPTRLLCADE